MSTDMLTAALRYAQQGWPVLPLHTPTSNGCSCYKGPRCNAVGKHPRTENGLTNATTDQHQIEKWWSTWPDANIGILTGSESGLLVVDVDNNNGKQGGDNLSLLAEEFGGLPLTLTAITGNGEHLFFMHPGIPLKNSTSKLADGVDVRADGGYVVAAPSLHANGKRYAWINEWQPLSALPSDLLTRLTTNIEKITTISSEEQDTSEIAPKVNEGERNTSLYKVACALRGQLAKDRDEILSILLEYNVENCDPPLDESEVITIADSACQHPAELSSRKSAKRIEQNPLYWFQFNTREWFSDQNLILMNDTQTGWHIRLKAFAWDGGGFLTADKDKLWRLAKAKSKKAFEKGCELVLADYEEVQVDGGCKLRHPQLAGQYAKTLENWIKKKEAAEASIASRSAAGIKKAA
jgi:Bifunctional DNA primase/polymerase, N-terminal/Primase C terminal 1 (PriCT-1)